MSIIKRFFTCLFVLVLLVPAISTHDDAISLSALLSNGSPSDDTLSAVRHIPKAGFDSLLATLLDRLETLHVSSVCVLHVEIASTPFQLIEESGSRDRSVTAPDGRAPPVA